MARTGNGFLGRRWRKVSRLMSDSPPSDYSSIAPRKADGTRALIFPNDGSGRV